MPYSAVVIRDVAVLSFPPGDVVFRRATEQAIGAVDAVDPREVQRVLRGMYPHAVIRARESLASYGGPAWYVYRDGRYSPFSHEGRWWEDPSVARIVIDDAGNYLDANDAALALLNVTLDELRAAKAGDFTVPQFRRAVPWVLQLLQDTGELHSTSILRPRDGRPDLPVEFHFARAADGPGRNVSTMRPVPRDVVDEGAPPI